MKKLLVTYGGSHRKNQKCREALRPYFAKDTGADMPATLGSKRRQCVVFDSPEMRETLKRIGGSVARKQWQHLNP